MSGHIRIGTQTIVQNEDGAILMLLREDFRIWTIPGGALDAGESVHDGAKREVREETGIEVELKDILGVYALDNGNQYTFVFTAKPVGGEITTSAESLEVRYFKPDEFPENMTPSTPARLRAFLDNHSRQQLYIEQRPLRLRLLIKVGVFVRDLRNRFILRRPTPELTCFNMRLIGVMNRQHIANVPAQPNEVGWQTLLHVINHQRAQAHYLKRVIALETDIKTQTITLHVEVGQV